MPVELAAGAKFQIRWPSGATVEVTVPKESGYLKVSE
jgi:hypothetical protein